MTQHTLAQSIGRFIGTRDNADCIISDLTFFQRKAPTQPEICVIEPSIVVAAQGTKQVIVGGVPHVYDPQRFIITSLDMPALSQSVEASPEVPCLGLTLKLDLRQMAELIAEYNIALPTEKQGGTGLAVGNLTPDIVSPLERLVGLLDEPAAIPVLAPLIKKEICYRLLQSDQAARLWQIIAVGTQTQRIAKAVSWLKTNYTAPLRIEELAQRAQMSLTTFHLRFRELTTMSPLQYQKWLRLHEARWMMLNRHSDVATAAFDVGYESPSQFTREYRRLFGQSPKRDIDILRQKAGGGEETGP